MIDGIWLIGFIIVERLCELVVAHRNTARLLALGAREFGHAHYPLIVALHAAWIAGLVILGRDHPIAWPGLAVFIVLQAARLWMIASLGRRWTTRVIVVPRESLVARGPYRFVRHPNYLIVAMELAVVPLMLGMPVFAVVFTLLNAGALIHRIAIENAALARAPDPDAPPSAPGRKPLAKPGLSL